MAETVRKSAAYVGPPISEMPAALGFLLSEANWQRSREKMTAPQGTVLLPGDFVTETGTKATAAGSVAAISAYAYDASQGPVDIAVIARDAEVTDAYLLYGEMDPAAVNTQLATLGIIVREGVLPNTQAAGFGTPGTMNPDSTETGIPSGNDTAPGGGNGGASD